MNKIVRSFINEVNKKPSILDDRKIIAMELKQIDPRVNLEKYLNRSKKLDKNHKKWKKIHQELDKLSEMVAGD